MARVRRGLGIVAAACTAAAGAAPAVAAGETPIRPGKLLLKDPFDGDTNRWGTANDEAFLSRFAGGRYEWTLRRPGITPTFVPERTFVPDIVLRAVASWTGTGFLGLICRGSPDNDSEVQFYQFLARDGYATIRLADIAGRFKTLARNTRGPKLPERTRARLEAQCASRSDGAARLVFKINGEQVLSTTVKKPLKGGDAGIAAIGPPAEANLPQPVIRWDSFEAYAVRN